MLSKRLFDFFFSFFLLIVFAPLLLVLAGLVRLYLGAPVLFRQERPGFRGTLFHVYKFRTMRNLYDSSGNLLPDAERLTSFGQFLRRLSLDELPQLFNVLRGEMSFVGPRPLLVEYLALYNPQQMRRHEMPPGITGWAQVNGRNAISWEEKFHLDIWYIEHWSFWLDMKILCLTFCRVLKRKGVSAGQHVTMPKFTGSAGGES